MQSNSGASGAAQQPAAELLLNAITRFWAGRAIWVAAKLGLPDTLAAGPKTVEELAHATLTHTQSLSRLMRALVAEGLFTKDAEGRFRNTSFGAALATGAPASLRALALAELGLDHYEAWAGLLYSVETGKTAFDHRFGMPVWDYYRQNEELGGNFSRAMTGASDAVGDAVLAAYDFGPVRTLVDIGGAHGRMLRKILDRYPQMQGVLFDLPEVIARVSLNGRVRTESGDFFRSVPPGGDGYLLKWILHDWDDEQCIAILRNIRKVIAPGGRLLVAEAVLPPGAEPHFAKLFDLNMLVMTGGRERSEAEFRAVFQAAGFRLTQVVDTAMPVSVVEGRPA